MHAQAAIADSYGDKLTPPLCTHRDITEQHRRLAEIVEMIHTASLVHDDVLDESSVRRGT